MSLQKRAQALETRAAALLKTPAAYMLPGPVRELIGELVAVVALLAERQEGAA